LGSSFFYLAHSLVFAAFDTEQNNKIKNKPTQMARRTRRMLQPSQSKPTPHKKANDKTNPTTPKKAKTKTARAKTLRKPAATLTTILSLIV
jgi:hypothetical protein